MEPRTHIILDMLYHSVLVALPVLRAIDADLHCEGQSFVMKLARKLGYDCPIETRKQRRTMRVP